MPSWQNVKSRSPPQAKSCGKNFSSRWACHCRLAKEIGVLQRRIGEIVAGKRSITADIAARLGVFFGMEAEFWLNLQAHYDLALTREALAENLAAIHPLAAAT